MQWLTAGKGIVHCEMFPLVQSDQLNPTELFQIWFNLPAKNKMVEPHFTMFWNESIARERLVDAHGRSTDIVCVAGAIGNARGLPPPPDSWASTLGSDLAIWTVQLSPGAHCTLPPALGQGTRRQLYFFKGSQLQVGGQAVPPQSAIEVRVTQAIELVNGPDASVVNQS